MRHLLLFATLLLGGFAAHAQEPTQLPSVPQPGQPMPPPSTAALPGAEVVGHPGEVIGQTYSIETVGGIQFNGILRAATEETLTFETRELGLITLQRTNLKQLTNQTPEQARRGFNYVGNSTRMFLVPTARNLHQGEGSVQVIDIVTTSINYGLTDNISVGVLVPTIPFVGVPFLAFNTKLSAPVTDKLNVGAGVIYGFATGGGGGAGAAFGLATYGTADANLTLGLGYGFTSDGSIGSSPVGVVGGNLRVSRLFSLVNETYIAGFNDIGGVAGLAGVRYSTPRFGGSLGGFYLISSQGSQLFPAYLDVSFRFGKVKLR